MHCRWCTYTNHVACPRDCCVWHTYLVLAWRSHSSSCAQELDPGGKFRSMSNVWQWRATRAGADVPFAACCTPSGFDSVGCVCAGRAGCADAPDDSLNTQKGGTWGSVLGFPG